MLFNSYTFIIYFLPIVFFLFLITKKNFIKYLFILSSLIFYSYSSSFKDTIALIILISLNYIFYVYRASINKKIYFLIILFINLGFLGYFKYTNFILENFNFIFSYDFQFLDIYLPLAISFYTFQQIIFHFENFELNKRVDYFEYFFFVTYFPQLIAGPILRWSQFHPQLDGMNTSKLEKNITVFFVLFSIGLFKKVVLADGLGIFIDKFYGHEDLNLITNSYYYLLISFAFSFQIYFDFSGYCDMAIAISKLFGLNLPYNFNSPYKTKNISDFWQNWHITLSKFFRDFIFFKSLYYVKRYSNIFLSSLISIIVTFFISGLWHGASWNFVLWGLLNGAYLIVYFIFDRFLFMKFDFIFKFKFVSLISIISNFLIINLIWIFFRVTDINLASNIIKKILSFESYKLLNIVNHFPIGPNQDFYELFIYLIISFVICFSFPNSNRIFEYLDKNNNPKIYTNLILIGSGFIFLISILSIASVPQKFIYYQF